ncbi:MAG: hypothetical protein IKZ34_01465, partial [Alphaproteobacteria bacterium]|nr:hypothetical protein [Alphaproteobacteria bacterium]
RENKEAILTTIFEVLENNYPDIHLHLSDIKKQAEHMGPYSFFSYVLNNNGIKHNFISALGNQVIDPLEEFMTICLSYERTQPGTLYHFIKWFITGGSEVTRDMDASNGIRIVTVHGSKGLESPVVFLIDTIHTPKTDKITTITSGDTPVWLWAPRGEGSTAYSNTVEQQKQLQIAEYYRLLYVAMTRAKDELYIHGFTPDKKPPEEAWHTQLWRVLASNDTNTSYIRITNDDIK